MMEFPFPETGRPQEEQPGKGRGGEVTLGDDYGERSLGVGQRGEFHPRRVSRLQGTGWSQPASRTAPDCTMSRTMRNWRCSSTRVLRKSPRCC